MWLHMAWYADNLYRHQLLYYYLLRAKHGRYGGASADRTLGPERIDPKAPETAAPSTSSAADASPSSVVHAYLDYRIFACRYR